MNSKLVRFVLAAVCMGIVLPSTTLWAQSKVAFFDPQQILGKFKPFQEAQREYGRYEEELNREFTKMQNELKEMKDEYERQKLMLYGAKKQEREQALMRKEEELQRLVSEVTDPERGKLAKKQQELTQPILAQVNEVVAKVAKDNGYDYVLNTAALVYANEDHDLTEKVLEELDKTLEDEAGSSTTGGPSRGR
jgi:outer membrane protein